MLGSAFIRKGVLTKNAAEKYVPYLVIFGAIAVGAWIDRQNAAASNSFHNKSMLYGGRDLKEGETIWK